MASELLENAEEDALAPARRAFDDGDYKTARSLAQDLLAGAQGEAWQSIQRFLQRVSLDPVMVWVFVACLLFSIAVVVGYSP